MKRERIIHFIIDILLVSSGFFFIIWILPATKRHYIPAYDLQFASFLALWLFFSVLFGKFRSFTEKNYIRTLDIIFRSNISVTAIVASLIFFFNRFSYSRKVVFGTLILATFLELLYSYLLYIRNRQKEETDTVSGHGPLATPQIDYTKAEKLIIPESEKVPEDQQINTLLEERYLRTIPGLFHWTAQNIPLHRIRKDNAVTIYSHHIYNIAFYDEDMLELFINLHSVNDLRHINNYFKTVWKDLKPGGYYLLCGKTNDVMKVWYKEKMPPGLSQIFYFLHFCFHRVMPKIPGFSQLYFAITKGRNRAFSFTEILGRLYYCGFSHIASTVIENRQYIIVKKDRHPITGQTPTYGPLIKLNRVGKGGKPIKVLKMRTMYPYSEFLQDYVYQKNQLEQGGKFRDDFRITTEGKIMRRLWLDELPMLINLLRGDIKIVGVRPISKHYMGLYSEELQALRKTVKPGFIPPYYADMPNTIEEIEASEVAYIHAYKKHRFSTDLRYLFKALKNILFKKARSA